MSELPSAKRCCSRKWWVGGLTLILLIAFLAVWYLTPAQVIAEPLHLKRNADGRLVAENPPDEAAGLRLNVQATKIEARNNTSSSSSETHSNPSFLTAGSLTVLNSSDHLLMQRVGAALVEQLKEESALDRIDYFPHGHRPELGGPAADLYLMIELHSIEQSGLLDQELKAEVIARFGTSLVHSNFGYIDQMTPPTVRIRMNIQVGHESTLTGVESPSARFSLQGKDIAKQISDTISKRLKSLRESHGPLPDLPASFRPDWQAAPDFPFLAERDVERLSGVHGFMLKNESCWRFLPNDDPVAELHSIRDELLEAGWSLQSLSDKGSRHLHVRMAKGGQVVEVFNVRDHFGTRSSVKIVMQGDAEQAPKKPDAAPLYVRYLNRVSLNEIQENVNQLFDVAEPDLDTLLVFRGKWNSEQRARAVSMIEELKPRSVDAWIIVAEIYSGDENREAAREALMRASILLHTKEKPASDRQRIEKLAEKHGIEKESLSIAESALLDDLGFVRLDPDAEESQTLRVRIGEPASFYFLAEDGTPTVYTYRLQRLGRTRTFRVLQLEASGGRRSWSTFETTTPEHSHRSFQSDGCSILLLANVVDDDHVEVTATISRIVKRSAT